MLALQHRAKTFLIIPLVYKTHQSIPKTYIYKPKITDFWYFWVLINDI